MPLRNVIILFLSFFFATLYSYPQLADRYFFRHIDQSDGLMHNRIFSIVQDGNGFIWILSPNGLQRYDGFRFVNYPYDQNNPGGITYKQDCSLFADKKDNRLWIVHENIAQLDLHKNNFIYYTTGQLKKDPSFGFETYKDSIGHSWLAGNFGFFYSDNDKSSPGYLTASWLTPGNSNSYFIDKERGQMWAALWSYGLLLFDKKTKKIYSSNYNPIHHPLLQLLNKKELFYFFLDNDKNVWITSSRPEFYKYDPSSQKITTYLLSAITKQKKNEGTDATQLVHCIFEDNHHIIWVGTQNAGLLKYNKETDSFTSITGQNEKQQSINYNYDINCITQDKEDNIWLGTDKGITVFNPYRQYFQSVYHDDNDPLTIPKNEIQECIETSNGDILAATWGGGMTIYDNQWHFKKNIRFTNEHPEYNLLWSFIQKDDHTIWIGCQHGYIHIYDPVKETIQTIHPPELNNFTIQCMKKDKQGNIWLGLHDGKVAKWDKSQNRFYGYNENDKGITQTFAPVLSLFIDDHQQCWVGTETGLKQFDMEKMIYSAVYVPDKNNPGSVSANNIGAIEQLDDSTLLVGTLYGGLNFFHFKTKIFTHLTASDGLPSNTINNIKKDKTGQVWFTTDYGLYKYTPGIGKFIRYNIEPGLINSSFKSGNFYCLKDNRWIITTTTEIISFNPDSLQNAEAANMRVDITGFKIFDKTDFIDSLLYAGAPVKLSHEQNFISIEYGVLSFSGLQEPKYYYRLSGIDKDWVYAGTKRFANYTNLEPGEYIFNVKTGNDGNDQKITSFTIIITPPFWKTTWFRLIVLASTVALLYFLFKKRIGAIRREAELKHRIAETEMMALRAQMNPHFIFNCLNAIDNLVQTNQKEKATTYLARFAKLIRSVLDSSKNNVVLFQKDYESLQLYLQMEKFRCNNKFDYELKADDELLQGDYKLPPLIVQPFVENAIHHGLLNKQSGERKLLIRASLENEFIKYTVTDNGVGRARAQEIKELNRPEHKSYGIQITKERIHLYNQNGISDDVTINDVVENGQPAGTKAEIYLKIYDNN
jgi:ligand-binding sensor domain-containing protein